MLEVKESFSSWDNPWSLTIAIVPSMETSIFNLLNWTELVKKYWPAFLSLSTAHFSAVNNCGARWISSIIKGDLYFCKKSVGFVWANSRLERLLSETVVILLSLICFKSDALPTLQGPSR